MENNQKSKNRNITIVFVSVFVLALVLVCAYALGVLSLPPFISELFAPKEPVVPPLIADNIAPQNEDIAYTEALPRDKYANAIADISIPDKYYNAYTISIFSGETVLKTDYTAIYNSGDWWVQTSVEDVIMSTAVCKNGVVKISDNADNTSVVADSKNIDYAEYFGFTPLSALTEMIHSLANGAEVNYVSKITDFSLSFTQSRGTGENIFSFNFKRADGISEEYTFAFESATILSAVKYSASGEKIYQMEMKNSKNNIEGVDIDALFVIN